jgi:hypothetical protein
MEIFEKRKKNPQNQPQEKSFMQGTCYAIYNITKSVFKRQMRLNKFRLVHIDFTNKKIRQQPIFINVTQVPYTNTAKSWYDLIPSYGGKSILRKNVMSSTSSS